LGHGSECHRRPRNGTEHSLSVSNQPAFARPASSCNQLIQAGLSLGRGVTACVRIICVVKARLGFTPSQVLTTSLRPALRTGPILPWTRTAGALSDPEPWS